MNLHLSSSASPKSALALAIAATISASAAYGAVIDNFPILVQTSSTAVSSLVTAYEQPNNSTGFYLSGLEYGVHMNRDAGAPDVLRKIELEYYSNFALAGGLVFTLYANDGPLVGGVASPGTVLSQITTDIQGIGNTKLSYSLAWNPLNLLPSTITATLKFSGIAGANEAGWYTSSSANTVGTHPDFFWLKDAGNNWTQQTFAVPEPTETMAAGGLALMGFALARRWRRASR